MGMARVGKWQVRSKIHPTGVSVLSPSPKNGREELRSTGEGASRRSCTLQPELQEEATVPAWQGMSPHLQPSHRTSQRWSKFPRRGAKTAPALTNAALWCFPVPRPFSPRMLGCGNSLLQRCMARPGQGTTSIQLAAQPPVAKTGRWVSASHLFPSSYPLPGMFFL